MRRLLILLLAAGWASSVGCGPSPDTPAGRCAEVARLYLDLQGGVALVGEPQQEPDGSVAIEYEGSGAMNLPMRGSAVCSFAPGAQGELSLQAASVNGTPLTESELAAVRRELPDAT